jgi:hypothetical protein
VSKPVYATYSAGWVSMSTGSLIASVVVHALSKPTHLYGALSDVVSVMT